MNDIELIKSEKFADNDFRAAAIATGCKLWECKTDAEKIARVRLYRDWRVSKIYGKETKPCFEKACAGVPVPMFEITQEMFDAQMDRINGELPFTDTSATPEDDSARFHGQKAAV